jgi:DNA-binding LacI/PurR family transcriptional regulator
MENTQNPFIPIYQKLFEHYRQAILVQEYQPGSRIDSINELMDRHSVSRETAKLVLKKLADEGLIIQRPGKGSFVADLGPRKKNWGIIVPFFSAQIEQLIYHLHLEAAKMDRQLEQYVDYNSWHEEIRLVGNLINQRYEAVIVVPTFDETKTADFYRHLVSSGTVVTLLDHTMAGSYFTYAIQSYDLGVKRAIHYMLNRTHGNLAFVKNNIWVGRNMVQEFMESTFKNFIETEAPSQKAFVFNNCSELIPTILKDQNIGAIFCYDDVDAIRIIGRLQEWNFQIPEEISIISYGNTDLAQYFTPKITSIDTHCEEMVEKTAYIIQAHIKGEDVHYFQFVIQPELVVRET